ncbi:F-box-like domain-containing protein [Rhizoctonia solani AG-1 IA]|uniref:F-box-like domain-containing protein n=1 Tax=Thanatephorus cucumeris (strain AG1-IA) TaxID=983506 RepID=L8WL50_THACA|nr:F-box-like domain-containing protein [Rhizoctonia solani AG-1 IA]
MDIMNYACDRSAPTAPIDKLPTELLIDVFLLVLSGHCQSTSCTSVDTPWDPISYPDCLTHVCYRWRMVAISVPSLWTHIDLNPHAPKGESLIDYARNYAHRSGTLPLELRLRDKACVRNDAYIMKNVFLLLGPRTKSLDFTITSPEILHFHRFVFEYLLPRISPRVFKTLRISCEVSLPDSFIAGRDSDPWVVFDSDNPNDYDWGPNILHWEQDFINYSFSGVTNLRLCGVFFNWSSPLYHGLVDLRLTSPPIGGATDIYVYTLRSILSKCPELRIFHFSLQLIIHNTTDDESLFEQPEEPVFLPELEVIHVSTANAYTGRHESFHVGSLLHLLAPGSKPLQLSLETGHNQNEHLLASDEMKGFFSRSKVERLCLRNGHQSINDLRFCHLPVLKFLVLDSCRHISAFADPSWPLVLQSVFVNAATLTLEDLRSIVGLCPDGLVLSRCMVLRMLMGQETALKSVPEVELQAIFPAVNFTTEDRLWCNLVAHWGLFD